MLPPRTNSWCALPAALRLATAVTANIDFAGQKQPPGIDTP
jgi:hypothetical protein